MSTNKPENEEISALLKEADIRIPTSHIEGTPKVILEAASSGLPFSDPWQFWPPGQIMIKISSTRGLQMTRPDV
ncbi:MAG: hypothetical protein HKL80_09525 [Acidimicrobiales bacterium]|nr:hypothetical protein [Acidimicrobiales bacterium]